jgi:hypothetical protein
MAGRLIGEAIATVVTLVITRDLFRPAFGDFLKAVAVGLVVLGVAIALGSAGVGLSPLPSIAMVFGGMTVFGFWALSFMPSMLDASFPAIRLKA